MGILAVLFIVIAYLVLVVCVALNILSGHRKGLFGVLIKLGVTLTAAVVAFFLSKLLGTTISKLVSDLLLNIVDSADLAALMESSEAINVLIKVLCGGISLPIIFLFVFIVLHLLGTLVSTLTTKLLPKSNRIPGMILGGVRGLVLALVILFPLMGYITLFDADVTESDVLIETIGGEDAEKLENSSRWNLPYVALRNNVVKLGMRALSQKEFEGEKIDVYTTISDIGTVLDASEQLSSDDFVLMHMTKEQTASLSALFDSFDDSVVLSSALSDIVSAAATEWQNGSSYMGMSPILGQNPGAMQGVYDKIYEVLTDSDKDTVVPDLKTLLEAMQIISEVEGKGDDVVTAICTSGKLDQLIATFAKNPHMQPVVPEIMKLGVQSLAQKISPTVSNDAAYDDLVENLSGIVAEENSTVDKVSDKLAEVVEEHNMELSEEVVDSFAEALVEKAQSTGGTLTKEDMIEVFADFSDKYGDLISQLPDGFEIPDNIVLPFETAE